MNIMYLGDFNQIFPKFIFFILPQLFSYSGVDTSLNNIFINYTQFPNLFFSIFMFIFMMHNVCYKNFMVHSVRSKNFNL